MLAALRCAYAGIGPENVIVVVNGESPDSLRVANAYVSLRAIPASHVVVLQGLTGTEFIDVAGYRKQILQPILEAISTRGLGSQIDCITYSVDVPYSVGVSGDVAGRKLGQVLTQQASTNGLTYLMDWVLKSNIEYLRLDINTYCRRRTPVPSGQELTASEQEEYNEALAAYDAKDYRGAIAVIERLLSVSRSDAGMAYNLACCYALNGQKEAAISALRKAMSMGWRNHGQTSSDPDFASVRNMEAFQQIIDLMKKAHVEVQPGVPFRRSTGWNRAGESDPKGAKYMLSTFLGVTAGRGNSVDEIIDNLRRSQGADFTAPKGSIYFERNGDVRSTTREWGFEAAASELRRMGVNAVVEDGILPQKRTDVAGAMIGIADFKWPDSKSTILPGAIVEHLTSLGGMINKGAGQTPCTDFIRAGASGSSGAVTEPYALQEKFPSPFIHVHYAQGYTLAESFYMSLYGPYQLLVIGDPLCRPWAKKAEVKLDGLTNGQEVRSTLVVKPTLTSGTTVREYRLYVDGKFLTAAKPAEGLRLDPKSLGEGYHDVSVVAEAGDATAAQYRVAISIRIPGSRSRITSTESVSGKVNDELYFKAAAPGARGVDFIHLGRVIGSSSPTGSLAVRASRLGVGTSLVYPVAMYGETKVYGKPIVVTIQP